MIASASGNKVHEPLQLRNKYRPAVDAAGGEYDSAAQDPAGTAPRCRLPQWSAADGGSYDQPSTRALACLTRSVKAACISFAIRCTRSGINRSRRSPARRQMKQNPLGRLDGQTHNAPDTLTIPQWHRDLRPRSLRTLFGEIHRASQIGCPALMVLGPRAALDSMCTQMWGDLGTFQNKLQRLSGKGMIAAKQRHLIATAIEIGNATTLPAAGQLFYLTRIRILIAGTS